MNGTGGRDPVAADTHAPTRALRAGGLLAAFNDASAITAADVHIAQRVTALTGEHDESVQLATALAARAVRMGHVCLDLAEVPRTLGVDRDPAPVDLGALPWPEPAAWQQALAASPCVTVGAADDGPRRPLRLHGGRLYLDRMWREERRLARTLLARAGAATGDVDEDALALGLEALFPREDAASGADGARDLPRLAAGAAVRGRLTVVAGGPGTGKSTTVAGILALLGRQQRPGDRRLRVALAAPTGRAAARLTEAVHAAAASLACTEEERARLLGLEATTVHRLLGARADSRTRFRHDAGRPLPQDVVVVDEASMVSLSLMDALVQATRPRARLLLVGDAGQLASVEAGAVLGDIVGAARPTATGDGAGAQAAAPPLAGAVVTLERVHRYGGGIALLADAVRRGEADDALSVLARGGIGGDVAFIDRPVPGPVPAQELDGLRAAVTAAGRAMAEAAQGGDAAAALLALDRMRVLCVHRHGSAGVAAWATRVERWLRADIPGYGGGAGDDGWYVGRPLLLTRNEHDLGLSNGDTGVVVGAGGGRVRAAFVRRGAVRLIAPSRLPPVATLHALTVHRSQGSQFAEVAVVLPDARSPLLTRELLLTAITRAEDRLTVIGSAESVRTAVTRPIARASGLQDALRT